jgi:glycyl-tRNA synthetase beta chain
LPKLLLELGVEELPASACYEAEAQLPDLVRRHLGIEPSRLYIGPRRLAFTVEDLPERTPDEWAKGPPVALRDQAAAGFARRHGLGEGKLEEREGHLWARLPGRPIRDVLPERLDAIIRGLQFPKTMWWDESGLRFPRPIRWRTALVGDDVGRSYGHRFTHGEIEVTPATYEEALRAASVEPDAADRERRIREGLDALGGWRDPLGKLREVVHLVEWPVVLEGTFDERFLRLPPRVIETAMQSHQRYFPLGGNRFAFVANGGDPAVVRAGNEQVLEGRLDDAAFTFERDVATGIEGLAAKLGAITFFEGAGSFADKGERLAALVRELDGDDHALEAARLAKADQAAELVREFPELEGHIGATYAELAGYPSEVVRAIDEHYLPDAADAALPSTQAGKVLSAADKVDTLNVSFGLGHRPTGSRDPYGLRRAAIGLCRLASEGALALPRALLSAEVREFVEERYEGLLDAPVEFVRAARGAPVEHLGEVARLAEELAAAAETPEFGDAYTVYDRADRIAGRAADEAAPALDRALLVEPAERELAELLAETVTLDGADVRAALAAAARLAPVVERFFDEVLVMAEDPKLRSNRLRLLLDVRDVVGRLGKLSEIPG